MTARPPKKKRVIVIGSGLAGLTAAYLIHNDPKCEYDVEIFESVILLIPCILPTSLLTKWMDTGLPPVTGRDNPPHKPRDRHSHADIFEKLLQDIIRPVQTLEPPNPTTKVHLHLRHPLLRPVPTKSLPHTPQQLPCPPHAHTGH